MSDERTRSGFAWLTPDDLPEDKPLFRGAYLPANASVLAAITGALEQLTYAENWEEFGAQSPEDTAEYYQEIFYQFIAGWDPLPGREAMPVGSIIQIFASLPPEGWLLCNGDEYDRVDYPDLYAVLPANHKVDADTFVVPSMAGRFPRGALWPTYGDGVNLQIFYDAVGTPNVSHFFCNFYIKATSD